MACGKISSQVAVGETEDPLVRNPRDSADRVAICRELEWLACFAMLWSIVRLGSAKSSKVTINHGPTYDVTVARGG
jgi:hypothetical protein